MKKQDRIWPRTATQLERKYNFGQDITEVVRVANSAKQMADNAETAANNAISAAADAKATAEGFEGRISALEQESGGGFGLSVVNGLLCITYEE